MLGGLRIGFMFVLATVLTRYTSRAWVTTRVVRKRPAGVFVGSLEASSPIRLFSAIQTPLSQEEIYQELKLLSQEIRRHDELYYAEGSPELEDDQYDALVAKEAELCQAFPNVMKRLEEELPSATRYGGRVGINTVPLTAVSEKISHLAPMLSLDNVHSEEELVKWLTRVRKKLAESNHSLSCIKVVTEPKLDGLSLSLRYEKLPSESTFRLKWAATRGDGKQGQDVTTAVEDMKSIPSLWTVSDSTELDASVVEIRGEVVFPLSAFERVKSEGSISFSNARNAASGVLLRKASNQTLRRDLRFFAYDIAGTNVTEGVRIRNLLASWGFRVPEPSVVAELSLESENPDNWGLQPTLDYHGALQKHKEGSCSDMSHNVFSGADHDMDGVVHKLDSVLLRDLLGSSSRFPRWAVAHKFPTETSLTSLLGIDVQVGRTGALTPVAHLEPVDIGGVTVQRATLHNFKHLQEVLGSGGSNATLTRIPKGSKVLVRRAGEVIPQIMQRVDLSDNKDDEWISLETPTRCPACGSAVVWDESPNTSKNKNATPTGQVLRCGGPLLSCPPRAIGAFGHALSRDAMDITGLSEARIQQLMDANLLKVPSDLFRLASASEHANETMQALAELPGWGEKSAKNLQAVVDRVSSNGISLGRFIYSLGIRHAGQQSSELIAGAYGTVDAFLEALVGARDQNTADAFAILGQDQEITKGIGPVLISSLWSFAQEKELVEAAKSLAKAVPVIAVATTSSTDSEGKPWQGWSVVFTGTLPEKMSRTNAQNLAKTLLGAKATPSSVSKSTSLLVAGERGGKKLVQARELGVEVMDAADFVALINQHSTI